MEMKGPQRSAVVSRRDPLDSRTAGTLDPHLHGLLDRGLVEAVDDDLEHACADHPTMDRTTLERVYRDAWSLYYTDSHVETLIRRAAVSSLRSQRKLIDDLTLFSGSVRIENVHPLQFGLFRRKVRTQRRHGMPVVNPLLFYPARFGEIVKSAVRWIRLFAHYRGLRRKILADPAVRDYTDLALTPVASEETLQEGFVAEFAAKIPNTHGAPKRIAVG